MRILVIVLGGLVLALPVAAESLDPLSTWLVNAAETARTPLSLAALLEDAPDELSEETLWADAVRIARRDVESGDLRRPHVVRLMEAALVLGGVDATDSPLDNLSSTDIVSMRDAIEFPHECDLILYLLNRGPSLADGPLEGRYMVIRISKPGTPVEVHEQADVQYLGIGPESTETSFASGDDPVCKIAGEHSKSLRLNLAALPEIVLAAKAYRAAELAAPEFAAYPLLIGTYALDRAFRENPTMDFRTLAYAADLKVRNWVRQGKKIAPELSEEVSRLERAAPGVAFRTRLFEEAARLYEQRELQATDHRTRTEAAWGRAISLLAYGSGQAAGALGLVATLIREDTPYIAGVLGLVIANLTDEEMRQLGGNVESWLSKVREVLGPDWLDSKKLAGIVGDGDVLRLTHTIGRPDIANRYLIDRLRSVMGTEEEDYLFRRFAAFTRDYCYVISFTLSPAAGWVRRKTKGYDSLLDFLDSVTPEGEWVRGGEVVVSDGSYVPYPALSPEEDCAISDVVFGQYSRSRLNLIDEQFRDVLLARQETAVRGFESWVQHASSRQHPRPSLIPYLKLVYQEWFYQAFEQLRDPSFAAAKYSYRPVGASAIVAREQVLALARHPAATAHVKNLITLFVQTRDFLETNYP
ncbi:MAG: hypothetical protein F4X40_02700 [Chloroflexi bacterium]|nr:hypothetical protein [Chloroflexota bacterium]